MNEKENKYGIKKTMVNLRSYPEVEVKQIERVLDVFEDMIYQDDEIDIAYIWKEGYMILLGDTHSWPPLITGEAMCEGLLEHLKWNFLYENHIDFEEDFLPPRYWSKFIQYARRYMDKLPEYSHLLNPYRKNEYKGDGSCVIYLNF